MASSLAPGSEAPEVTLDKRTLLVSGISGSTEETARNRELCVFFEHGAEVRWVGTSECILAFPTESQTASALAAASKGRTSTRVGRIGDLEPESVRASYYRVAAEMHEQLKPERTSRVANRLIGAALGIKVPVKKAEPEASKPKAAVVDAWDD